MLPKGGSGPSGRIAPARGAGTGLVVGLILAGLLVVSGFVADNAFGETLALIFLGVVVALPFIGGIVAARANRSFLAGVNVGWVSGLILAITLVLEKTYFAHTLPSLIIGARYFILCLVAGMVGGLIGRLLAGRGR